ncbi:MAG: hypothetical protein QW465_01425 [Candidatus Anstonellales archaeon]
MFIFEWQNAYMLMFILYILPSLLFLFKRLGNLNPVERFLVAIPINFISISILTTILGFVFGALSITVVIISYVIYLIILLYWIFQNFKAGEISVKFDMSSQEIILSIFLILLILSNWNLRVFSFSPIYYEFDPYFYLDGVKYLLYYGVIPESDDSAWNPYNVSTHRNPPLYHYTIGSWYLYLYGNSIDSIKLSATANLFPPLNAVMMLIGFYMLALALSNNRILALVFTYFVSLIPVFILKFQAGVFEYQPMNFFLFTFLIASFVLYIKTKEIIFLYSTSLTYAAVLMGAVAMPAILLTFILMTLMMYIKYRYDIQLLLLGLSIMGSVGGLFMWIYSDSLSRLMFGFFYIPIYIISLLRIDRIILEHIESRIGGELKGKSLIIGVTLILVMLILVYPFRDAILYALQYNTPLERTIAEQNPSGQFLDDNFGKLGIGVERIVGNDPVSWLVRLIIYIIAYIPTTITNNLLGLVFNILGGVFNLVIEWIPKETSIAYSVIFYSLIFIILELYRATRDVNGLSDETIITLPMYVFSIGLLKAKFEIYFTFGYLFIFLYLLIKLLNLFAHLKITKLNYVLYLIPILFAGYSSIGPMDTFALMIKSNFLTSISNDPTRLIELRNIACSTYPGIFPDCNQSQVDITTQYSRLMCNLDMIINRQNDTVSNVLYSTSCNHIPFEWYDSMMFLKYSTEPDSIITSWWDYGHWINYWGERKATIRNDHSVLSMILDVAYAYIQGDETVLRDTLKKYGSNYVLFDQEIILSNPLFGGKFYALNYLSCAKIGQVDQRFPMMSSKCEYENLWESVLITNDRCNIDGKIGRVGAVIEYTGYTGAIQQRLVNSYCIINNDGTLDLSRATNRFVRTLFRDQIGGIRNPPFIMYRLNDSKLHRGIPVPISQNLLIILYTYDEVWFVDGNWTSGYEDRTSRFYNSSLYRGFILETLDGFDLVYNNGYVKIYRLR